MKKKKLFVSFSGGETSAFMVQWLLKNKSNEYEMIFVFANTSKEREETLVFADKIDKHFNLNLVWIEAVFSMKNRGETTYKIVDFNTAKRNGEVFEEMIKDYGISNQAYPHCTRELKTVPLTKYAKNIFGKEFYTAIGYRVDEFDRMNNNWKSLKHYYPLIENNITKQHVNTFWRDMPFRLKLKGYEGNCNKCWKKSLRKLMTIEEDEMLCGNHDDWWIKMEKKYGMYIPPHRIETRKEIIKPLTFYRKNLSGIDIRNMSLHPFVSSRDDSQNYTIQKTIFDLDLDMNNGTCDESCEPFK